MSFQHHLTDACPKYDLQLVVLLTSRLSSGLCSELDLDLNTPWLSVQV